MLNAVFSVKFEPRADEMDSDDLLRQVQEAADKAREKLQRKSVTLIYFAISKPSASDNNVKTWLLWFRQPHSRMGYVTEEDDGELTLNFLNPDNDGFVSEKERVITLGRIPVCVWVKLRWTIV